MRREIEILQSLESEEPNKSGRQFAERIFESEIANFKKNAYQSPYHRYVVANGYPIPQELLESRFYLERNEIEGLLKAEISRSSNIVLLGCEGSGKTTLIHRVCGSRENSRNFLYIDTADLGYTEKSDQITDLVMSKVYSSMLQNSATSDFDLFSRWLDDVRSKSPLLRAEFENEKKIDILQNYLLWLEISDPHPFYVIVDNIDSLSIEVASSVFSFLNYLGSSLKRRAAFIGRKSFTGLRFIVACRTTTYSHVVGISRGMFVDPAPTVIRAEDDIRRNVHVADLLERFVLLEHSAEIENLKGKQEYIQVLGSQKSTVQVSFEAYIREICTWLQAHKPVLDEVIKPLCGRSLRRMKVYGVRLFASPIVASLALMESTRYRSLAITRNEPAYFRRRILEALFDFRVRGLIDSTGTFGLPLNLFYVFQDESHFYENPLLGVTAIDRLQTSWDRYAAPDVEFAKSMDATLFVQDLEAIGFKLAAIKQLFLAFAMAGVLRRVNDSEILISGNDGNVPIYKYYIADEIAIDSYYKLVFCADVRTSTQYYNASVRRSYDCGYYYRVDSILLECFLNLIFLIDIVKREDQLLEMNRDSGIMLRSFTSSVRGKILPYWHRVLSQSIDELSERRGGAPALVHSINQTLLTECRRLMEKVTNALGRRETLI